MTARRNSWPSIFLYKFRRVSRIRIQKFHFRSQISISDTEFPYMIQNFHLRSGIAMSFKLLFHCKRLLINNVAKSHYNPEVWLQKSSLLGRMNQFSGPDNHLLAHCAPAPPPCIPNPHPNKLTEMCIWSSQKKGISKKFAMPKDYILVWPLAKRWTFYLLFDGFP